MSSNALISRAVIDWRRDDLTGVLPFKYGVCGPGGTWARCGWWRNLRGKAIPDVEDAMGGDMSSMPLKTRSQGDSVVLKSGSSRFNELPRKNVQISYKFRDYECVLLSHLGPASGDSVLQAEFASKSSDNCHNNLSRTMLESDCHLPLCLLLCRIVVF